MKKTVFILFIMCISCQKDHLLFKYSGSATAEKNGISSEYRIRAEKAPSNPGKYYIGIDAYDDMGYLSEHLYFKNFDLKATSHHLTGVENSPVDTSVITDYATEIGGEILGSTYRLIASYDNLLVIEKIHNNCISGTFQCAFEIESWGKPGDPDTVYFNKGIFDAKILK